MTKRKHTIEDVIALRRDGEKLTQRDQVLFDLAVNGNDGVCGTTWLAAYIPRYSVHLHTLRGDGYTIRNTPCRSSWHHHNSKQVRFVLERRPYTKPVLEELTPDQAEQMTIEEGIDNG